MEKRYHKAPLRCKIHVKIFGSSVSLRFARCAIGCRQPCDLCAGCENNINELVRDSFRAGVYKGAEARENIKRSKEVR